MKENLKINIESEFGFSLNKNQYQDIKRLIYEISRRENISAARLINRLRRDSAGQKQTGRDNFFSLKKNLIRYRFPLASMHRQIGAKNIFLNELKPPLANNFRPGKKFVPRAVFFEKKVRKSRLIDNLSKKYPAARIEEIPSLKSYLKKNKFSLPELKKPLLFIVKENWDFIKPCPCTKDHLSCGYWIFNLGFGCPFDCSYCYLQQYTNSPGIILPANLDDFFRQFDIFAKKIKKPVRMGTGEFSDSLALDHITNYSSQLIPYFGGKNILFELKTKSSNIANLLKEKPSSQIIISWSLNPQKIAASQELGASGLNERIKAAETVQAKGFRVAFHFDPVIHYPGWEKDYRALVKRLYSRLKPPFAWISLGTLRCHRGLKPIAERRFPRSNIFYGELFLDKDKKIRYPEFLRKDIYKKMLAWIREFDSKTPVYLCMENKNTWKVVGGFDSTAKIEKLLIENKL